jgi:uncharacterized repeat protein (TIGR04052 family)
MAQARLTNMKTKISILVSIALASAALVVNTNFVSAHAELVSAEPAPNSKIIDPPTQLKLNFSETLVVGSSVTLLDTKNKKIELSDPKIDGKTLTVSVPKLSANTYVVQWKALSEDGHAKKGSYKFTLDLPNVTGEVSLKFALKAGKEPVSCGKDIAALGNRRSTAQIIDARMYVSNVRLISVDGKETPVTLTADKKWQSDSVALLDFEDANGKCRDFGTQETRNVIVGKAPTGKYVGVAFTLGVPQELNHADVTKAQSPLNISSLWWNWQVGYKFARIDLSTNAPAPKNNFLIHLGSTGCGEMATSHSSAHATASMTETMKMMEAMSKSPPKAPCKNTNTASVRLTNFDPSRDVIVADLATLLSNVNIADPSPEPAGCMSGIDDKDCPILFRNFGLSLASGQLVNGGRGQKFFRIEK